MKTEILGTNCDLADILLYPSNLFVLNYFPSFCPFPNLTTVCCFFVQMSAVDVVPRQLPVGPQFAAVAGRRRGGLLPGH